MLTFNAHNVAFEILIVDNVSLNALFVSALLQKAGYRVRVVSNGASALLAVRESLPDLILLDIIMPGMDGYELCRRLKAESSTQAVPVIFMSALDGWKDKAEAFDAGGVDYLLKPFHFQELLAKIHIHLSSWMMQRELVEQSRREPNPPEDSMRPYQCMISANRGMLGFVDKNHVYRVANDAYSRYFGKPIEEIVGHSIAELFGARDFNEHIKPYLDRSMGGVRVCRQSWFELGNGQRHYFDVTYLPYTNNAGEIDGVVIAIHDLTAEQERNAAQAQLHDYARYLEDSVRKDAAPQEDGKEDGKSEAATLGHIKSKFMSGMGGAFHRPLSKKLKSGKIIQE